MGENSPFGKAGRSSRVKNQILIIERHLNIWFMSTLPFDQLFIVQNVPASISVTDKMAHFLQLPFDGVYRGNEFYG